MLFKNILKTNRVSIGPLEYCGNAQVVKGPNNTSLYVEFLYFNAFSFEGIGV
jgi:hypothetical protein